MPSSGRTIIIGDVHGCLDELERLLKECAVTKDDQVFLVGDLVAKGPDSQGVVQLVRESGYRPVLGNHDAHVLKIRAGKLDKPPKPTHAEVAKSLEPADWKFLEELPLYRKVDAQKTIVVHGGLVPGVPLEKQERDIVINLRSIDSEGRPSKKLEAGDPWASKWPGPDHVVFGHDAVRGLQRHAHATGLDSGCVYGRELTALILPERKLVSVKAKKAYSEPGG